VTCSTARTGEACTASSARRMAGSITTRTPRVARLRPSSSGVLVVMADVGAERVPGSNFQGVKSTTET
jgi:hypothetical protein